jgi:hypothetical protein
MTELANGRDAPESDSEFDVRHGTDSAGSVEPGDLGVVNTESRKRDRLDELSILRRAN